MITVTEQSLKVYSNLGRVFICTISNGKQSMVFSFYPNQIRACVLNASNRCWRKLGRAFRDVAEMTDHYRSDAVRAMIAAAVAANTVATTEEPKRMHRGALRTEAEITELERLRREAFPHLYMDMQS